MNLTGQARASQWKQGDLIEPAAAATSGPGVTPEQRVIVVTHTCDLQDTTAEPRVALLTGAVDVKKDGSKRFAKSIRHLQLEAASGELTTYDIRTMQFIDASVLAKLVPWSAQTYPEPELRTLRQWLAQRYYREAYPDDFIRALQATKLVEKMRNALKGSDDVVREIRFALDRSRRPEGAYHLVIVAIYNTATDPKGARCKAVTNRIAADFGQATPALDGIVHLVGVTAQPDADISYRTVRDDTTAWRLDELSLRDKDNDRSTPL